MNVTLLHSPETLWGRWRSRASRSDIPSIAISPLIIPSTLHPRLEDFCQQSTYTKHAGLPSSPSQTKKTNNRRSHHFSQPVITRRDLHTFRLPVENSTVELPRRDRRGGTGNQWPYSPTSLPSVLVENGNRTLSPFTPRSRRRHSRRRSRRRRTSPRGQSPAHRTRPSPGTPRSPPP